MKVIHFIFVSITVVSCTSLPRIINGEDAYVGQFPWHVSVAGVFPDYSVSPCSGAIISEDWILTTAFCVNGTFIASVHAGSINTHGSEGQRRRATNYIIHENFDSETLRNDIALVQVEPQFFFDRNVNSVTLYEEEVEGDVVATVTGWGHSNHDDYPNETFVLQFTTVSTIENSDCQKVYGNDVISSSMLCTSGGGTVKGPCVGDAGAPLVINTDRAPVLVGIFSFIGESGCEKNYPAGYTRVASYTDWIKENTGL